MTCRKIASRLSGTRRPPGIWNPLPCFDTVKDDGGLSNVQTLENFVTEAQNGSLPQVSWIAPSGDVSEHPPLLAGAPMRFTSHAPGIPEANSRTGSRRKSNSRVRAQKNSKSCPKSKRHLHRGLPCGDAPWLRSDSLRLFLQQPQVLRKPWPSMSRSHEQRARILALRRDPLRRCPIQCVVPLAPA
jgi:hypothetical protein